VPRLSSGRMEFLQASQEIVFPPLQDLGGLGKRSCDDDRAAKSVAIHHRHQQHAENSEPRPPNVYWLGGGEEGRIHTGTGYEPGSGSVE